MVVAFQFKCEVNKCVLRDFSPSSEGTYVFKHLPRETLFVILNFRDSVDVRNNRITFFDVKNTSSNVTTLKMDGNPIDCSWRSRQQKESVKCRFSLSIDEIEDSSNCKCSHLL
ncbi:uncharacterized protein LOC126577302 [Anopheles aquasalis]|uniref:uncharacterized protein LOC126577302 n=1 Tax=Anopheles aquasalis TaxID=42839 RepID=UPI00215B102E|nr:uncharacterized protein LOC126577302 [Anopheles aquasalis]